MKLIVRGFKYGALVFERPTEAPDEFHADAHQCFIDSQAKEHIQDMMEGRIGMVEIEFCGAPENERFLRIGIEPHGMVIPLRIDLVKTYGKPN